MRMDERPGLAAAIWAAEARVAGRTIETVVILDLNGRVVYEGSGERDRVFAPISALRGNVVIHNHPGGGSLSRQYVRLDARPRGRTDSRGSRRRGVCARSAARCLLGGRCRIC